MSNDIIHRRNEDFYHTYRRVTSQFPHIAMEDAIIIAIHSPAREFYLSEEKALQRCYALHRRRKMGIKHDTAKYLCFVSLYRTARNIALNKGISLRDAIIDALYNTAPRFYINRSTAYAIIQHHTRE